MTERKLKIPTAEERRLLNELNNLKEDNTKLNKSVLLLEEVNDMNMMAMTEMYEENLKLSEENSTSMLAITELYEILMGGQ